MSFSTKYGDINEKEYKALLTKNEYISNFILNALMKFIHEEKATELYKSETKLFETYFLDKLVTVIESNDVDAITYQYEKIYDELMKIDFTRTRRLVFPFLNMKDPRHFMLFIVEDISLLLDKTGVACLKIFNSLGSFGQEDLPLQISRLLRTHIKSIASRESRIDRQEIDVQQMECIRQEENDCGCWVITNYLSYLLNNGNFIKNFILDARRKASDICKELLSISGYNL